MRQSYRIIPVYTADVSGVCSALYELGVMTVMHDPSGCNSTYNTHDELRWYEQDSLIFLSGLTQMDAIMGNDRKFIEDIETAAAELKPKFIALAGSPIPFLNGTDFPAIAKVIEKESGIPTFSVPTNGMHDYTYGAGLALEKIAERFTVEKEEKIPRSVNLLGVTPLDFGHFDKVKKLKENLERRGWKVISSWAMGDSLEDLQRAAEAQVNLVVSAVGLSAAKALEKRFSMPYVIGTPNDWIAEEISKALEEAVFGNGFEKDPLSKIVYLRNRRKEKAEITLIGESVVYGSLAAGIEKKYGLSTRVLCPLEKSNSLIGEKDKLVFGEEAMEEALQDAKIIVADPLYKPICPKKSKFYELAHVAFSGRIFM